MKQENTPFSHFILTQFNLRNFPKSNHQSYEGWIQWTRERIILFKKYCLPSVLNQSNSNFKWILFFDSQTPDEFSDFLKELKSYQIIDVYFLNGLAEFKSSHVEAIRSKSKPGDKWIITSRIDNDDCIHKDFVDVIQQNIEFKNNFMVSMASGYILRLQDMKLSHYYYPMSPFISIIELNSSDLQGIFKQVHTKWIQLRLWMLKEIMLEYLFKKKRESRFILKRPYWIQIVHGNNVSNSFYRGLPVLKKIDLKNFSIQFSSESNSLKTIFRYYDYVTWKRYFKSFIVKKIIGK